MARNNNLYCKKCGEKLMYSKKRKAYYCVNPNCSRYNGSLDSGKLKDKVTQVREDVDEHVDSLFK